MLVLSLLAGTMRAGWRGGRSLTVGRSPNLGACLWWLDEGSGRFLRPRSASRSSSAVSAWISFCSSFAARFMASSTLAPMSETATTTRPAWPVSRCSPSSLRSWRLIPAAEHAAHARRRLGLLDDLGLAAVAALDGRRVVGVDQVGVRVQVLDELVVGLGVGDAVVHPD